MKAPFFLLFFCEFQANASTCFARVTHKGKATRKGQVTRKWKFLWADENFFPELIFAQYKSINIFAIIIIILLSHVLEKHYKVFLTSKTLACRTGVMFFVLRRTKTRTSRTQGEEHDEKKKIFSLHVSPALRACPSLLSLAAGLPTFVWKKEEMDACSAG